MRRAAVGLTLAWVALLTGVASEAYAARAWGPAAVAVAGDGTVMHGDIQAAYTSRGELVAFWHGGQAGVAVRPRGAPAFGPAQPVGPTWGGQGEVVVDGQGGAVIAFLTANSRLRTGQRPAGGRWQLSELAPHAYGFSAAAGTGGQAAVAFIDRAGVKLAYRPANGDFGPPVLLRAFTENYYPQAPDVAITADGTVLVGWQSVMSQQEVTEAVQRMPSGTLGPVARLSRAGWNGYSPLLSADGSGHAMAVWGEARDLTGTTSTLLAAPFKGATGFGAPRAMVAKSISWLQVDPVEGGRAFISYLSPGTHPSDYPVPAVVGADMATGATTAPTRLGDGPVFGLQFAANARGDAAVPLSDGGTNLGVTRRAPGGAFAPRAGARCPGSGFWVQEAAMSPYGDLSVFIKGSAETANRLLEDRYSPVGTDCTPWIPPAVVPARPRPSRTQRLALQARMPRGGKLISGRYLTLRASCGTACRIRASGSVKVAGRRRTVPLKPGTARRTKAGSATVRVALTRARAALIRQALRRRKTARARIRLRATAGKTSSTLTFRVRLRR